MKRMAMVLFACFAGGGCHFFQKGVIRSGTTTVIGQPDAGKPASLAESHSDGALALPAGSRLVVTKWEPVPWVPAVDGRPEVKAEPAKEVTEVILAKDSMWHRSETRVQADTGTVDTSIAKARIAATENRYLLFASLGAAIAAGLFLYIKYPTPALICGAASIVFFLAWKLSDLPSWFYVVGVAALAGAFALWRGHERGEKHAAENLPTTP